MNNPLRSIAATLFIAITLTALVVVVAAALLFRLSLGEGFNEYVSHVELSRLSRVESSLVSRYNSAGGWGFLRSQRDLMPLPPDGRLRPPPPEDGPPPNGGSADAGVPPNDGPPPDDGPPPNEGPPPNDQAYAREGRQPSNGLSRPYPPDRGAPSADRRPLGPARDRLDFGPRLALFDTQGLRLMGPTSAEHRPRRALRQPNDGSVIGYIALAPVPTNDDEMTQQFLQTQTRNLVGIVSLAIVASALAAWFLARHFRSPIAVLAAAARKLAGGALDTRVQLTRQDELGRLAVDFNTMAQRLERYEQSRRQWVADTSHELRTPLTILRAHTQAMRDGVMPFNTRGLDVIDGAVGDMEALVSDLYQLAKADVGAQDFLFEPVMLGVVFDEVAQRFTEPMRQQGLRLTVVTPPDVLVRADPTRLQQLLANLLNNSMRYTDRGGEVRLAATQVGPMVELVLDDSPPGVSREALSHLFERFYRAEVSRSRQSGGSGLGLAICKSIVEAHGGRIAAQASPLGGLRIMMTLPVMDRTQAR